MADRIVVGVEIFNAKPKPLNHDVSQNSVARPFRIGNSGIRRTLAYTLYLWSNVIEDARVSGGVGAGPGGKSSSTRKLWRDSFVPSMLTKYRRLSAGNEYYSATAPESMRKFMAGVLDRTRGERSSLYRASHSLHKREPTEEH